MFFTPRKTPTRPLAPRPLAEIVQWLQQQHQQKLARGPNDTSAAPQHLEATGSLQDRWRIDAATLGYLRELATLDLSACEISSYERCSGDEETWASDNLSILLNCMPQLTSLDLRNSLRQSNTVFSGEEERYRDEMCDASLLEAIGKLTSLQVLRVREAQSMQPKERVSPCLQVH